MQIHQIDDQHPRMLHADDTHGILDCPFRGQDLEARLLAQQAAHGIEVHVRAPRDDDGDCAVLNGSHHISSVPNSLARST